MKTASLKSLLFALLVVSLTVEVANAQLQTITVNTPLSVFAQPVAAAAAAPKVTVDELYLDAMFAVPSAPIAPPKSIQIPFQAITCYTRTLSVSSNFTESFSGIPPSVGAICLALRDSTHGIDKNRELYSVGGGAKGFKTLSLSLGALQLPQPSYTLDFPNRQIGRLMADWLSFTGGSASSGVGGDNLTEFCKSPIAAFRVLQDPGAYASTAIIRFATPTDVDANTELVMWCIHQKVFEAFWDQGETFPSRVVVDDVLN